MANDSPSAPDPQQAIRDFLASADQDQIHDLIGRFLSPATDTMRPAPRPDRRKPRREDPAVLRVRVDLKHARPPIWRRLDLRSDLTLDQVHRILQTSFGWWDYHLHRFSLGGDPFERGAQLFLCPFDVEDGEDDGIPEDQVHLDEALQNVGDTLHYCYDYGDSWDLLLKVESVQATAEDAPDAVAVGGRRAAPPEDCGGITDAEDLADVLEDPARFDLEELNEELAQDSSPEALLHPALSAMLERLRTLPSGRDLNTRASAFVRPPDPSDDDDLRADLQAVTWFLERAADDGMPLTGAGYLKPVDVEAASRILPSMHGWIGKNNREIQSLPLLEFREALQQLKILRKYKGALLPTRGAAAAQDDPGKLWGWLASTMLPKPGSFEHDATVLLLVAVGSTPSEQEVSLDVVTRSLIELGWRVDGAAGVPEFLIRQLPAHALLSNLRAAPEQYRRHAFSATANTLAREALAAPGGDVT